MPTKQIVSRHPRKEEKEEKHATPRRRSERLLGIKRKSYKEKTPEPMDLYGDSDFSDDRSPSSWAAAGRDDNDLYYW